MSFDTLAPPTTPRLRCDMDYECRKAPSMIDKNGFIYCAEHGIERRDWKPCRKLRPHELRRIARGEQVARY